MKREGGGVFVSHMARNAKNTSRQVVCNPTTDADTCESFTDSPIRLHFAYWGNFGTTIQPDQYLNFNNLFEFPSSRVSNRLVDALSFVFIVARHDAEASWFATGSVLNTLLSVWLKQILNQERPSALKSDPGMPSSHAQSIFFPASYLRVSQQLHTVSQVVVGAIIGSIFSILWYWLWNSFMVDAFVSSLWVRLLVVLGSAGFCLGFVLSAIRYWV
ncbi:hypothetical protein Fmac_002552 [Flemingia macrophylla]|uniref:Phosphatidic acid phosphatase type 2/haloperoxidase domain-containing protein n=1 Tax=Flemingia macrophylla TaxID=520843 RepID=A0ABD1NK88_9FABA